MKYIYYNKKMMAISTKFRENWVLEFFDDWLWELTISDTSMAKGQDIYSWVWLFIMIEGELEERLIIFYLIAVKTLRAHLFRSINARRIGINEG